jgi:hypothetical protein
MKLNIEPLYQMDPRWGTKKLGTSNSSISGYGCNLCCHSMLLKYYKHDYLPDSLNALYIEKGVYQDLNLINFWKIPEVFPDITADQFIQCPTDPAPLDLIDEYLDKGKPVIALVDFDMKTQGLQSHFILIIGKDNGDYLINDPMGNVGDGSYWFKAKYGDPTLNIYGLRLYSGPVVVQEEHYSVVYKGQTMAQYDKNPIDTIDSLTKEIGSVKESLSQEISANASLQASLSLQEKDNAQLIADKRSAETDRDNALAELKETHGLAHDILGMDDLGADAFRAVKKDYTTLQGQVSTLTKQLADAVTNFKVVRKFGKYFLGKYKG